VTNRANLAPSSHVHSRLTAALPLIPAEARFHSKVLPHSCFMTLLPTLAGRYENSVERGESFLIHSGTNGRVEKGGRVEKERKASDEAPRG